MTLGDFVVRRDDLHAVRFAPAETTVDQTLPAGAALLRIERYGLTTNNVTYAVVGDSFKYWSFFPTEEGYGRIPVWGFATVVASQLPELSAGERVYGYLPMSSYLRVQPEHVGAHGFVDASAHRKGLPEAYQRYQRAPREADALDDLRCLLRPLFGTGFLIDAWLQDEAQYGARQVVVASASSRTAAATAWNLARRSQRDFQVIGLTSPSNRAFCERLGFYDRVLEYGDVASALPVEPSVLIDIAGDRELLYAVHRRLADGLRYSCTVGLTHRALALGAPMPALPGPAPQFFFAPTHVDSRVKAWGADGLARRLGEAQDAFLESAKRWLTVEHVRGEQAIEAAYRDVLDGRVSPDRGFVVLQ